VANKGLSNCEFLGRVQEYLASENGISDTDLNGQNPNAISLDAIQENNFYLFDSDSLLAFGHTIEDLALEDGNGRLLAAMQDCAQFEPHRERYWQLAATLDDVQLVATGKLARAGKLKFCNDAKELVKNFWMVLYEGKKFLAMLLCEQANTAEKFDEKKFAGFYTFNPRIISQAREDMAEALAGDCVGLKRFARLQRIDQTAKKIKIEFAREKEAIDIAIGKLQNHGKDYHAKHFLEDLNKTLERLNRLQTHLPELIVEQQKKS
jgi:hypothetical protein